MSVHPRVCGEHAGTCGQEREVFRFIPASAGNTNVPSALCNSMSVHPRVCGEHGNPRPAGINASGSSPRLRGTQSRMARLSGLIRFIPASAGNTDRYQPRPWKLPVHPRVCGEHIAYPGMVFLLYGSSPRLRGTRLITGDKRMYSRFIPASAGNTQARPVRHIQSTVHPRVCGEHGSFRMLTASSTGSSPRLRGTHRPDQPGPGRPRFIPASAGNTCCWLCRSGTHTVHPRVCGEHGEVRISAGERTGSSPRLRGTQSRGFAGSIRQRFIPASAGNTPQAARSPSVVPVHPRVCGEHIILNGHQAHSAGSSPRLRGTRHRSFTSTRYTRFIPASAGNTLVSAI